MLSLEDQNNVKFVINYLYCNPIMKGFSEMAMHFVFYKEIVKII
jgi:hypothetical protein